jgi:hypothetical protein
MPKRSWVVGRDGFPCGTQTMLNTGTMDEAGNIFVGGRTDATAADVYPEGGMRPYLVRIAPDGSIVQKVFRFADDFDLPTFAFGPLVLGTAEKTGGTSLYWAITAYDWLLIFRIDPTTLVPQQVLAVKPKGTGAPFTRNFFTSAALHDGKLYMGGSFSSKDAAGTPAVHGFVLVRNAADLGPVSGARLASPVEGYDVNLPISLAVDTADPRNMFIAGVAGRPTGVPDQEEYRSYVLKLRAPK